MTNQLCFELGGRLGFGGFMRIKCLFGVVLSEHGRALLVTYLAKGWKTLDSVFGPWIRGLFDEV
jgi:hypothetical protein